MKYGDGGGGGGGSDIGIDITECQTNYSSLIRSFVFFTGFLFFISPI